jgi:hypothetical protein
MVHNAYDAAQVLSASLHRGAASWIYDPALMRVMPEGWDWRGIGDPPPAFTAFEAIALARALMAMHQSAQSKTRTRLRRQEATP